MSQEIVDLVRRFEAALNADEMPDGLLTPDFVMINAATAVTDRTYEGIGGILAWKTDIFEAFDDAARFEVEQVVADSDDFVVTMNRIEGVGAASEAPLLFRWAAVIWCEQGRISRVVGYRRRREALEAVGLVA